MVEKIDKKVTKIIISIVFTILLLLNVLIIGFILSDRTSTPTQRIRKQFSCEEYEFKKRKVFVIKSKEQIKNDFTILYFHGGSYVGEMTKQHWDFLADICEQLHCSIIVPDYPLTPKYDYRDVFSMIIPLYQEIIEQIEPSKLILMGDSAGGGLSLALLEKLGEEEMRQPGKTILISPWLDITLTDPEVDVIKKKDPILHKSALQIAGKFYSRGENNYLVNPINGTIKNLKNVTIYTGTNDLLNPNVKRLEERARQEGVSINIKRRDGAQHIWLLEHENEQISYANEDYIELIQELEQYLQLGEKEERISQ